MVLFKKDGYKIIPAGYKEYLVIWEESVLRCKIKPTFRAALNFIKGRRKWKR